MLCEKSFTVNARQAEDAHPLCQSQGRAGDGGHLDRYQPMRKIIDETLSSGIIGEPKMLTANLCYAITQNHRIVVPGSWRAARCWMWGCTP